MQLHTQELIPEITLHVRLTRVEMPHLYHHGQAHKQELDLLRGMLPKLDAVLVPILETAWATIASGPRLPNLSNPVIRDVCNGKIDLETRTTTATAGLARGRVRIKDVCAVNVHDVVVVAPPRARLAQLSNRRSISLRGEHRRTAQAAAHTIELTLEM